MVRRQAIDKEKERQGTPWKEEVVARNERWPRVAQARNQQVTISWIPGREEREEEL